jgi:hypothetical protein
MDISEMLAKATAAAKRVPDADLRDELTKAWAEVVRLRRILDAVADADGQRAGIVEMYAVDPDTSQCVGMGILVCCVGDEEALARECGAALPVVHNTSVCGEQPGFFGAVMQ